MTINHIFYLAFLDLAIKSHDHGAICMSKKSVVVVISQGG